MTWILLLADFFIMIKMVNKNNERPRLRRNRDSKFNLN